MNRLAFYAALAVLVSGCAAPSLQEAKLGQSTYDSEAYDFGVPQVSTIHGVPYDGPTPLTIRGAKTITTPQLRDMMLGSRPPILIDVIGGNQVESLPGAVWMRGAGLAGDGALAELTADLPSLTSGDKSKPLVFFCQSKTCWLSHNAAVHAIALGYTDVYWYRGGRYAWQAAGLPMTPYKAVL